MSCVLMQGTAAEGAGMEVADEQLHRCWAQAEQALSRMGLLADDEEEASEQLPPRPPNAELATSVLASFYRLAGAQVSKEAAGRHAVHGPAHSPAELGRQYALKMCHACHQ